MDERNNYADPDSAPLWPPLRWLAVLILLAMLVVAVAFHWFLHTWSS